jgi:uncharacterized protein (DUF1330 family)
MPGYIIGTLAVEDPETFAEYLEKVPVVIAQYGGTYLAAGPVNARLEGQVNPNIAAIIRFDSVEEAARWYDSAEYRAIRGIRLRSGSGSVLLVEGP